MSAKVTDKDNGYKSLLQRIEKAGKSVITVGIHEQEGAKAEGDYTIAEIAGVHEFGAPEANVPQRSWLRSYVDENQDVVVKRIAQVERAVISGKVKDEAHGLELLGLKIVAEIKQGIIDGIPPPLEDATIEAKGSSTPLIDTSAMITAITHRVTKV